MKSITAGIAVLMGLVIAAFAFGPEDGANEQLDGQAINVVASNEPSDAATSTKVNNEEKFMYFQMTTSMGDIFLELNNELAPISTANFLAYTEAGFYNGTIFHRVIENFMIQGGGFDAEMKKKTTREPIENEWTNGLSNARGTIAMARLGGRANSATGQFFINVAENGFLDQPRDGAGYAVFGKVVKGMDVVDKIRAVPTGNKNGMGDVPVEPVVIKKVTVVEADKASELGLVQAED